MVFVRSPYAHALLRSVDTSKAEAAPGVLGVFSAEHLGLPAFHTFMVLNDACARPALAKERVRFVGEAVVAVVAETLAEALDAAEQVVVDYEPLEAVSDPVEAAAPGAPLQFEALGTNVVAGFGYKGPDPLQGASRVVRVRLENQRVSVVPMETDAVLALPASCGHPTVSGFDLAVYVSTQMPHGLARSLAKVLGLDPARLRVIAPWVGGAFGAKAGLAPEHVVVAAASLALERPLAWSASRSESMLSMPHGRGQTQWVEVGFDAEGRITGAHLRVLADAGAYAGFGGGLALGPTRLMAQAVYAVPSLAYEAAAVVTNTTPMGAFRGAGRPEAAALWERTMDIAAVELGLDPVEIRRRNLLAPFDTPVRTLTGAVYDSGDYPKALERALQAAGYEELRAEQAKRRAEGSRWQLGIGVSVYVEVTAGAGGQEYASLSVGPEGTATIKVGTSAHGQGHATSFAMIVSERLGIPIDSIRLVQSDTATVPRGSGTGGSRSLQVGGSAVGAAAEVVLEKAKQLTADLLEASVADVVVYPEGRLGVVGVPASSLGWAELASAAQSRGAGPLEAEVDFKVEGATFPFGAHVAVVEVDTETGQVRPVRHVAVDDCGRIINPLLVAGQQHGGIAQGMAQALLEEVRYDDQGNPSNANLADYAMPSAAELPSFETYNTVTPTTRNPLGVKGIGESGTIGATPAVQNAVVDALAHLGVRHVEMPATPQRVWTAIRQAAEEGPRVPWSEPPELFGRLPVPGEEAEPEAASADI